MALLVALTPRSPPAAPARHAVRAGLPSQAAQLAVSLAVEGVPEAATSERVDRAEEAAGSDSAVMLAAHALEAAARAAQLAGAAPASTASAGLLPLAPGAALAEARVLEACGHLLCMHDCTFSIHYPLLARFFCLNSPASHANVCKLRRTRGMQRVVGCGLLLRLLLL